MKPFFSLLCLVIFASSCFKDPPVSPMDDKLKQETFKDVSYDSDPKQKMDLYLPEGRSASTKTLVLIHGGGWTGGDKSDLSSAADTIRGRLPDYAFINLNYRLAANGSVNVFPTQEEDVKKAIEFYLGKSDEYHVSKDLVLLGLSAGGHLVLLHGYKNDPAHHVKAVVDFFGPTDLVAYWNAGAAQQLALFGVTGKMYNQDSSIYIQSSPINFISGESPPTIVLQGGVDPLVPPSQSTALIAKLQEKGVINQYVFYPNEPHGWVGLDLLDSFDKLTAFIRANVH